MEISNINSTIRTINSDDGFTLIELVIVIAGLAALSSFAIPTYMNSVKLNKLNRLKQSSMDTRRIV